MEQYFLLAAICVLYLVAAWACAPGRAAWNREPGPDRGPERH